MTLKIIGAILIITGCGGYGILLVIKYRKEEQYLQELFEVLQYMISELQYKLTPLPDLCRQCAGESSGALRDVFRNLSRELDWQMMPDAKSCMVEALKKSRDLPKGLRRLLSQLGHSLGRFDLPGQICGLEGVKTNCAEMIKRYGNDRNTRLRNCQTLGICAGAALVILLV